MSVFVALRGGSVILAGSIDPRPFCEHVLSPLTASAR
jgi:hypothetical protein